MRLVSRESTGFAVLRREANEGGYFRPIVKEVVERYLDCGNPKCGFARIRCPNCHAEHILTFSCRTRGFCPSCHAKRIEEWVESRDEPSARHSPVAYIHGRVRRKLTPGQSPGPRPPWMRKTLILDVPHRQVVFTIPKRLRVFFKYKRRLLGDLCRVADRIIYHLKLTFLRRKNSRRSGRGAA